MMGAQEAMNYAMGTKKAHHVERIPMWELKQKNEQAGQYWFSQDTTRFFSSKVPQYAYKKGSEAFFISSEQQKFSDGTLDPRKYTIRKMDLASGKIDTVGNFQEFGTIDKAKARLKIILEAV